MRVPDSRFRSRIESAETEGLIIASANYNNWIRLLRERIARLGANAAARLKHIDFETGRPPA